MLRPYAVIKNAPFDLYRRDSGTTLNISKDGGALAGASATPTETPASSGIYKNTLTATEMSADIIAYKGAAGSSMSDGFLIPEPAFDSGVATSGLTSSITLRAGAPSVDLTNSIIEIVRGTGAAQRPRLITAYDTTLKVATVRPNWAITPDNTSVYKVTYLEQSNLNTEDGILYPVAVRSDFWNIGVKSATVQSGSTTSVIKTNAIGLGTDQLLSGVIMLRGTADNGICRPIVGYDTLTGDITVNPPFATAPANGDLFYYFGTSG